MEDPDAFSHPYLDIYRTATASIVQGYPDGSYHPAETVTRAQMAVYISRALAGADWMVPEPAVSPSFPDVPAEPTILGDAAAGQAAYAICVACHGARGEGNEQLGGPRLAGQSDWYLVRQLRNYQQGLRGYATADIFGKQMKPMAETLVDDKAIVDVVTYISSFR